MAGNYVLHWPYIMALPAAEYGHLQRIAEFLSSVPNGLPKGLCIRDHHIYSPSISGEVKAAGSARKRPEPFAAKPCRSLQTSSSMLH